MAFQGITVVEGDDGGLLPILEPGVARDRGVVLVGCPQALAPAAELAGGNAQPSHQQSDCKAGAAAPLPNELDDRITSGRGNPQSVQSSVAVHGPNLLPSNSVVLLA
jgi:hypothetical protein